MDDSLPILIEQEWSWFKDIKKKYEHMTSHSENISSDSDKLSTISTGYPHLNDIC